MLINKSRQTRYTDTHKYTHTDTRCLVKTGDNDPYVLSINDKRNDLALAVMGQLNLLPSATREITIANK